MFICFPDCISSSFSEPESSGCKIVVITSLPSKKGKEGKRKQTKQKPHPADETLESPVTCVSENVSLEIFDNLATVYARL